MFTQAGLTTGAGSEVGTILDEFHLRNGNPEPIRKPRERFVASKQRISVVPVSTEIPSIFDVDMIEFSAKNELVEKVGHFLANIERDDPDRPLPIFNPY